jgi:hypothetical protein
MKKILIILLLTVPVFAFTYSYLEDEASKSEVEDVVLKSYIHGAFNEMNYKDMKAGFHPDFAIFSADGEELKRYEIEDWVNRTREKQSKADFDPAKNKWDHKFPMIDVTGNSAMVKVELCKDEKHIYTDYLSLLKFDSGWKIVGKVYTKH